MRTGRTLRWLFVVAVGATGCSGRALEEGAPEAGVRESRPSGWGDAGTTEPVDPAGEDRESAPDARPDGAMAEDAACAPDTCPDVDLGSFVGEAAFAGTFDRSRCNHHEPEAQGDCSETGRGAEWTFAWTAPRNGLYTFDTEGSDFLDTVIFARAGGCAGPQLGCDDDGGSGARAVLSLVLEEGEQITLFLDTDRELWAAAHFVLNISRSCPDADGDGAPICEGDCDDEDRRRHPGAFEVCGDGITNACESTSPPDEGCGGRGVFVSLGGNDANPGTIASPVASIGQGIANAVELGGRAVYVAHGNYDEHVVLPAGISLFGGLDPETFEPTPRRTRLWGDSAMGDRPALVIQGSDPPEPVVIEKLDVEYRPDTRPMVRIAAHASPVIRKMSSVRGIHQTAIAINPGGQPSTGRPRIEQSHIWGGIRVLDSVVELIELTTESSSSLGGPRQNIELIRTLPGTRVEGCDIRARSPVGLRIVDGSATIANNVVATHDGDPGASISLEGALGRVQIENNLILGSHEWQAGHPERPALAVAPTSVASADLLVHSNYFRGEAACDGRSVGIELRGGGLAEPAVLGRFRNNLIDGGSCAVREAFVEDSPNLGPLVFENNALYTGGSSEATDDTLYRSDGTTSLTGIDEVNALPDHADNLADPCGMAQRIDFEYRIDSDSACIDAGSAEEAPATDVDGRARPRGTAPDIGPHELG